jgi:flagellar protein FlaJ
MEYLEYKKNKEIEERFPDFLRDVAENMRTGMTLPQAIIATKSTYYGALTPYVKRIATQIDWGVPFDEILRKFSKGRTKLIKRSVSTIIEAHRGGGDISDILDSVGKSMIEMNRIMKERSSTIYNQVIIGYVIFFLFIGILLIIQIFLLPSLHFISGEEESASLEAFYIQTFKLLILIQGFFAGLVIGKMSEGRIIAGVKHSFLLIIVGYTIISLLA